MSDNQPEISEKELQQVAGGDLKNSGTQAPDTAPAVAKKNAAEIKIVGAGSLRGFA